MSVQSDRRSEEFLKVSSQFQLGSLTTESTHPVTAQLSETAKGSIVEALKLLFEVDRDVLRKFQEFVDSGRAGQIQQRVLESIDSDGKLFFTGCGSTGRLSIQLASLWRDFWQRQRARGLVCSPSTMEYEARAFSVMAGGDFALIKAVEGFEDFTQFGAKQIGDLGVSARDVVFAITEGGETSFVIGTAWKGVDVGAKVYFVYNNPDEILSGHVKRSREVLTDPRIEKINLTTGPMAITGSTRMQATTIQLCVLITVLEMVLRELMRRIEPAGPFALKPEAAPAEFLDKLCQLHATLGAPEILEQIAKWVALEEATYRAGGKNNYFADRVGIDVLTDTTERSPTFCTPAFRKFDDVTASDSWSFLFVNAGETPNGWEKILKRTVRCVEWSPEEAEQIVGADKAPRTCETLRKITANELMRFKIGLDGLSYRRLKNGDSAIAILLAEEKDSLLDPRGFYHAQLEASQETGARIAVICLGIEMRLKEVGGFLDKWQSRCDRVLLPVPGTDLLLNGVTRVGLKILLNALSTCVMVRLGRVMGNVMVWVVPSNLKLIDRSTRYIQKLSGLDYQQANRLLFEVIEFVEPRMKADQAYPPVVGLAVLRARHNIGNQEAEVLLNQGQR